MSRRRCSKCQEGGKICKRNTDFSFQCEKKKNQLGDKTVVIKPNAQLIIYSLCTLVCQPHIVCICFKCCLWFFFPSVFKLPNTFVMPYIKSLLKLDLNKPTSVWPYLSVILYSKGTLNISRQVFESSYEESDPKKFLQKSRGELSLQLLVRV